MSHIAPAIKTHPRNRNFVWQNRPQEGLRIATLKQVQLFDEQGFFLLENAFSVDEIARVAAAIDPMEEERDRALREQTDAKSGLSAVDAITFTLHIAARSQVLHDFAAHSVFKDLCHDLIGDDARLYWDQSVYKKSGKPQEFPWHQDNGYTFVEPQQYITCWVPLSDVDAENGCPWVAPGLHKMGTIEHWDTDIGLKCLDEAPDAVCVPAKAGDVVVFSSLAPHRTGPNLKQDSVRKAYILQYAPDGSIGYDPDGSVTTMDDPDRQFLILQNGR